MFKKLFLSAAVTLSAATVYVTARGTPRVGAVSVSRETGRDTQLITLAIPDQKFVATSVWLQRVDARGKPLPVTELIAGPLISAPGYDYWFQLCDGGTGGDAVAHDGVFTTRVRVPAPLETARIEVAVSFKGIDRDIRSAPLVIAHH